MSEPAVVSASGYLSEFAEDTHIPVQRFNDCVFFMRPEFDSARLARSFAKKSFSACRYLTSRVSRLSVSLYVWLGPRSCSVPPWRSSPASPYFSTAFLQSRRVPLKYSLFHLATSKPDRLQISLVCTPRACNSRGTFFEFVGVVHGFLGAVEHARIPLQFRDLIARKCCSHIFFC